MYIKKKRLIRTFTIDALIAVGYARLTFFLYAKRGSVLFGQVALRYIFDKVNTFLFN